MPKKRMTIKVGDREYPCYPTMGAAIAFNDMTGKELEDIKGTSDIARFTYCCVKSACRREHVDFDMTLEDFADNVLTEDLNALNAEMSAEADSSDGTKKNP